jgi:DNA polymerase-3 subunit delta
LFGEEQFLVRWAAKAIADKYAPREMAEIDYKKLDGQETDAEEIISCCETLPLLADRKTVIVDRLSAFSSGAGRSKGAFNEERFVDYLSNTPPLCLLIITADEVDKRKRIYKTMAAKGGVYEFTKLDRGLLNAFIEKRLKQARLTASRQVMQDFVAATGYLDKDSDYTLFNVENDIEKLVAYCGGAELKREDVNAVMSANFNFNVFALTDAVSCGDGGEALRLLRILLSSGTNEFAILGLIFSQFDLMLSVRELMDRGKTRSEIQKTLGVNEYRLRIVAGHAERFSRNDLAGIIKQACEADRNVKTGLFGSELALEMFILQATSKLRGQG